MEINNIGYGRGSVHDFESSNFREYVYMQAKLEPWEGTEESLKILRELVCSQVGIKEDVEEMEERRSSLRSELTHLQSRITEAKQKWDEIESFMKKIGAVVEFDPIPF